MAAARSPDPVFESDLSRARLASYAALLLAAVALAWPAVQGRLLAEAPAIVAHITLEAGSIAVALFVFAVAWNSQEGRHTSALTLLGCAFLAVGILDFLDTLAFKGMPMQFAAPYAVRGAWFLVIGHSIAALALLAFAWRPSDQRELPVSRWLCLAGALAATAVAAVAVTGLPAADFDAAVLARSRIGAAWAIAGLGLAAALGFLRRYLATGEAKHGFLVLAALVSALAETFFVTPVDPYAMESAAGHLFKLVSRLLIYRSIFISAIQEPFARAQRLQADLAQSESRLAGILHSAMDAIITIDEDRRVLFFNEAAERVFRCPAEEAIGQPIDRFVPARYRAAHNGHVRRFATTGTSARMMGEQRVLPALRADGEPFPMEASISQIHVAGKRLLTVILRDVTARVAAEGELARAKDELREIALASQTAREEEKSRIARELHDELGQALTALKMDLAWLQERLPECEGAAKLLAHLASMRALIDSTVATTRRISADLRPLMLDDLGLTAAVDWLAQDFSRRSGIACRYTIAPEVEGFGEARISALFRVIQESLTNAARHSGATEVSIALAREGDQARLTVRDNGRGIREEDQRKRGSFGLIGIRERVYLLGGTVRIGSSTDTGTEVEVRLPLTQEHPEEPR